MNINLHIKSAFPAVYLINGIFVENADKLVIRPNEVTYVTVFPLSAALLPYTVKLAGGKARCNEELCSVFSLTPDNLLVRLRPRYNYVYSTKSGDFPRANRDETVTSFFDCIMKKDMASARKYLTESLSSSIDDASLASFFNGYEDIVANDGYVSADPDCYFLIDKSGKSSLFSFSLKHGLIDDITERE